jgi:hypothetical protein
LRLAEGTDCFLQISTTQLMVTSRNWMAIDSDDADPLAEPPDEVVALLDDGALADLIAAKRAHDEAVRRSRAPLLPPGASSASRPGAWWRVVHSPAVVVRAAPSVDAHKLGLKARTPDRTRADDARVALKPAGPRPLRDGLRAEGWPVVRDECAAARG